MSEKLSFRVSTAFDPEPSYPEPASASSTNPPSPPPFSSLYFPPTDRAADAHVTEPDRFAPPAFVPAPPFDSPFVIPSAAEAEVKAALPRDTKGESSKGLDDGEPPPPYTEGSSPLDGFTYVMAAAGGAASIITQVQQGGPPPANSLGGTDFPSFDAFTNSVLGEWGEADILK